MSVDKTPQQSIIIQIKGVSESIETQKHLGTSKDIKQIDTEIQDIYIAIQDAIQSSSELNETTIKAFYTLVEKVSSTPPKGLGCLESIARCFGKTFKRFGAKIELDTTVFKIQATKIELDVAGTFIKTVSEKLGSAQENPITAQIVFVLLERLIAENKISEAIVILKENIPDAADQCDALSVLAKNGYTDADVAHPKTIADKAAFAATLATAYKDSDEKFKQTITSIIKNTAATISTSDEKAEFLQILQEANSKEKNSILTDCIIKLSPPIQDPVLRLTNFPHNPPTPSFSSYVRRSDLPKMSIPPTPIIRSNVKAPEKPLLLLTDFPHNKQAPTLEEQTQADIALIKKNYSGDALEEEIILYAIDLAYKKEIDLAISVIKENLTNQQEKIQAFTALAHSNTTSIESIAKLPQTIDEQALFVVGLAAEYNNSSDTDYKKTVTTIIDIITKKASLLEDPDKAKFLQILEEVNMEEANPILTECIKKLSPQPPIQQTSKDSPTISGPLQSPTAKISSRIRSKDDMPLRQKQQPSKIESLDLATLSPFKNLTPRATSDQPTHVESEKPSDSIVAPPSAKDYSTLIREEKFDEALQLVDTTLPEQPDRFDAYIEIANNGGLSHIQTKILSLSTKAQFAFLSHFKEALTSYTPTTTVNLYEFNDNLSESIFTPAIKEASELSEDSAKFDAFIEIINNRGKSYLKKWILTLDGNSQSAILQELNKKANLLKPAQSNLILDFINDVNLTRCLNLAIEANNLTGDEKLEAYLKIAEKEELFPDFIDKTLAILKSDIKLEFLNFLKNKTEPTLTIKKLISELSTPFERSEMLDTFIENPKASYLLKGFLGPRKIENIIEVDGEISFTTTFNNTTADNDLVTYKEFVDHFIISQGNWLSSTRAKLNVAFFGYPTPYIYDTIKIKKTTNNEDLTITLTFESPLHSIFIGENGSAIYRLTYPKTPSTATTATFTVGGWEDGKKTWGSLTSLDVEL